ncbi:MAG: glycosyltransferase [Bauldia sp.]|nr:glycosyltransferase [Bauldia sp.]
MAKRDPFDRPLAEASGVGGEAAVYRDRARRLGLSFVPFVDLGSGAVADIAAIRLATFAMSAEGERLAFTAPGEDAVPAMLRWLAAYPSARSRLRISTPAAIRAALIKAGQHDLAEDAVARLRSLYPHLSAGRVAVPRQIVAALALVACVLAAALVAPVATLVGINLIGAVFFFGVTALRFVAAAHAKAGPPPVRADAGDGAGLPVYTILVPLHDEADLVPDLIGALDAISWPRDRLDIKLLLEAGDRDTIAAARQVAPGAPYEIVVVPPIGPRTKPKALSFALPFARGEFLTVYDAEDRPHPDQLREAFAAFARSGPELACLQSALVIDNEKPNWLSLSFAVEYAALFDALLPTLERLAMPLPLGGTSNHFRRAALEAVGGWDPFNVTEDADLGLRLARFGYRSGTLVLPTLEEAPDTLGAWLRQRTRWSKGWMQTWLVHTRHPLRLARELGPRGLLGFSLVSTGLIVSSLIYPIYLVALLLAAADPLRLWGDGGAVAAAVVGLNLFNFIAGYMAMAVLGARALRLRGRERLARGLVFLPVYWLLTSLAGYRALIQLVTRPHHWEKTPHRPRGSRSHPGWR